MGLGIKRKIKKICRGFSVFFESFMKRESEERRILILCHSLEKGMGMPVIKRGFGQVKAEKLLFLLTQMVNEDRIDNYTFQEGLAILKEYCDFQKHDGVDLGSIYTKTEVLFEKYHPSFKGGYQTLTNTDVFSRGKSIDFDTFVKTRHSLRLFSSEKISEDELKNVIDLAKRAPSACNRQPWKFYCSTSDKVNKFIMRGVPSQPFLEGIPYFGVVTVDKNMFDDQEIYQWYINGGIFLGYLVLSFHHLGIGSCIFQYPVFSENKECLMKRLIIPQNETIIAIIGYGKYPSEAKCIYADRRPTEEVLIFR